MKSLITATIIFSILVILWLVSSAKNDDENMALSNISEQDISRIELSRNKHSIFVLQKNNGQWQMISPYQHMANTPRINRLFELLSVRSRSHFPATPVLEDKLGFNQSPGQFQFNDTVIIFGATESINHRRYVKVGNTIHLIADLFLHQLMANAPEFIDNRIIPDNSTLLSVSENPFNYTLEQWKKLRSSQVTHVDALPEDAKIISFKTTTGTIERTIIQNQSSTLLVEPTTLLAWVLPAH